MTLSKPVDAGNAWQTTKRRSRATRIETEPGHDPVLAKALLSACHPSPENDRLYKPIDTNDPTFRDLVTSAREHGIMEPIVLTEDGWIVSGHRRHAAATAAGLYTVPVRYLDVRRQDDIDAFVKLLREFNRQRVKTHAERAREMLVDVDPDEAYGTLLSHRRAKAVVAMDAIKIIGIKHRHCISKAKQPFLDAIKSAIHSRHAYWPLSDRKIHYALLNDPPLIHAGKPHSRYANNLASYKSLTDVLTRARLTGDIPMSAIDDGTRPVQVWSTWRETDVFVRSEYNNFLHGYWRDLMQSQPHHIEIVGEKNTIGSTLRPIAEEYTIPLVTGRGYCSLPPRHAMAERYRASGKHKLILLIVSDFDPDGESIAHSFARSMRDDFGIEDVHAVKVALTAEQVKKFKLPPVMTAKKSSSQYKKFKQQFGDNVFELEALAEDDLRKLLRDAVDSVIDHDAYHAEQSAEKQDAAYLTSVRTAAREALSDFDGVGGDE